MYTCKSSNQIESTLCIHNQYELILESYNFSVVENVSNIYWNVSYLEPNLVDLGCFKAVGSVKCFAFLENMFLFLSVYFNHVWKIPMMINMALKE